MVLTEYALVAIGASAGACLRHGAAKVTQRQSTTIDPRWGIVAVNIAGSAALGALAASNPSSQRRLLLGTGLCGGFTTFSTFAVDTVALYRSGQVAAAVGMVIASNAGAMMGVCAAYALSARRGHL